MHRIYVWLLFLLIYLAIPTNDSQKQLKRINHSVEEVYDIFFDIKVYNPQLKNSADQAHIKVVTHLIVNGIGFTRSCQFVF